jgi:hypothetical protein
MKSSFSQGNSNCVHVTKTRDDMIRVRDTKNKTGDVELEFTPDEWISFVRGVFHDEFALNKIPYDTSDDRPMTKKERHAALLRAGIDESTRTPENLAYVNGRFAERAGWVPYTFAMFCRKYHHDPAATRSNALYDAFQTGRRAEAHESSGV